MNILISSGRVIDPSRNLDAMMDLGISDGTIAADGAVLGDYRTIDASGMWVVPGLIDTHVHLREPGQEYKEDLVSGLAAAAAGGFTAVMPMPNTSPPIDTPDLTSGMIAKARQLGGTRVYPMAAATVGRQGTAVGRLAELWEAGAVAFTDDGSGVADDAVMLQILEQCSKLDVPFAQHAEDPKLCAGGVIHAGQVSATLGLPGWPASAEESMVARDISLVRRTGARLHVQHISTKGAVDLVRLAKEEGLPVTAEVTPHHLWLTDEVVLKGATTTKVNPPLRPREHIDACREALVSGVIDMVATDHAPHADRDKVGGFEKAAFGMVGLETAVPLLLALVDRGVLTPMRMIEAMSTAPSRVFGLDGGSLATGASANVTIIDPCAPHTVDPASFKSKSRNTPFVGMQVPGRVVCTIFGGNVIYESGV